MIDREAFEAWWLGHMLGEPSDLSRNESRNIYVDARIHGMWKAWQASALPEALALLVEAREDWIDDYDVEGKPNDLGKSIDAYLAKVKG
jgi:hypothetical protein